MNGTDPTGKFLNLVAGAIGAGVGAIVSGGMEAYAQHKAGKGFDLAKIGSRAGKGALLGGAIGLTGGAAAGVVSLTGASATSVGAVATVALPTATVAAVGGAVVTMTNNMEDGKPIPEGVVESMATNAAGAIVGVGVGTGLSSALSNSAKFGPPGTLSGGGAATVEAGANAIASTVTEGAALVVPDDEETRK